MASVTNEIQFIQREIPKRLGGDGGTVLVHFFAKLH